MKNYFLLFILFMNIFSTSCVNGPEKSRNDITEININPEKSNQINIEDLIEDFEIIPLETNEESLIKQIYQIKIFDNNVYIKDVGTHSLKYFSQEGTFLSEIGHKGQGPGEFIQIDDFFVEGDTVSLFAWSGNKKWIRYTTNNKFLFETDIKFPFDRFCPVNKNRYLVDVGNGTVSDECSHYLYVIDDKFKVQSRIFPNVKPYDINLAVYQTSFCNNGDEILYLKDYCDTIYHVLGDNIDVLPKYRLNFGKHWYTKKFLDANYQKDVFGIYDAVNERQIAKFIMLTGSKNNMVISYSIHENNADQKFLAIYYKEKGITYNFRNTSGLLNALFSRTYTVDGDCFFSHITAEAFLEIAEMYNGDNEISKKLNKIMKNVDETDNPLIIKFKLRDLQ